MTKQMYFVMNMHFLIKAK